MKFGATLWPQNTPWPAFRDAAKLVDDVGFETVWAWDHFYALAGAEERPNLESTTILAAIGPLTKRVKIGALVQGVTYRHPAVIANMAATHDHATDGRAICGIGAAWNQTEHRAYGIDLGTPAERSRRFTEAARIIRGLLDGQRVTYSGKYFELKNAVLNTRPVQKRLPIMIGGSGEKKTLRTVAKYADQWNAMGAVDMLAHKVEVLRGHCDAVGRDIAEIEMTAGCKPIIRSRAEDADALWRAQMAANKTPMDDVLDDDTFWVGTPELIAQRMSERKALGFHTFLAEMAAPYDDETLDRWINEVIPMVDGS